MQFLNGILAMETYPIKKLSAICREEKTYRVTLTGTDGMQTSNNRKNGEKFIKN
jgi:hypothetical protein